MQRAQEAQLVQQTNQAVLSVRQQEIDCCVGIANAIGNQAALVGGFTFSVFTQNQLNVLNSTGPVTHSVYYVICAVTIAAAVHVVLTTMLLQVLGPGLALNGPVGSMARSAEGLKTEQPAVVVAYIVMMVSFAAGTILSFWVVEDNTSAYVSTGIFLVAILCWYKYCMRTFRRFDWERSTSFWDAGTFEQYDPNVKLDALGAAAELKTGAAQQQKSGSGRAGGEQTGVLHKIFGVGRPPVAPGDMEAGGRLTELSDMSQPPGGAFGSVLAHSRLNPKVVVMEGYMTKRGVAHKLLAVTGREPWARRYFVLKGNGDILYYKSRLEYRQHGEEKSIKQRPIELPDYTVQLTISGISDEEDGEEDESDVVATATESSDADAAAEHHRRRARAAVVAARRASSMTQPAQSQAVAGSQKKVERVLEIMLRPEDEESRRWQLRLDTLEEMELWLTAMKEISPKSFPK